MTLFGKVLLVFNLLAAGGFVYLATQDWRGRQTINATGLRYQLLVEGLPLGGVKGVKGELDDPDAMPATDEVPFRAKGPGSVPVTTVGKKLLDAYFQAAPGGDTFGGGGAVPNQLAEVRRVRAKVEDNLAKVEGDAERAKLLKDWLLWQVETFDERQDVITLADAGNAEALKARLMARFDGVLEGPKAVDPAAVARFQDADLEAGTEEDRAKMIEARRAKIAESRLAPLDDGERKAMLAHLLVHLTPDAAWQKRVMVVVGLRNYVATVAAQAPRMRHMSERVEQLMLSDQGKFLDQVKGLEQQARRLTDEANGQARLREQWVAQAVKEADLVAQRRTQLADLTRQLTRIKNEVDAMLVRQTEIEAGLFEIQREVALTLDDVYRLEAELADRERKLLGSLRPKN